MNTYKRLLSVSLAVVLIFSTCLSAAAITVDGLTSVWSEVVGDENASSVTPGRDDSEMRFCCLSGLTVKVGFTYGLSPDLSDGVEAEVKTSATLTFQKRNAVTLSHLKQDTTYYYAFSFDGKRGEIYSFKTGTDDAGFTALLVSDSQIGRSGDHRLDEVLIHDTAGWDETLRLAFENDPEISLILSAGDQTERGNVEKQYRAFL
ncbi:MAG: fibronectin type III domain-containing protein, partial [Clostridiales bacterium]|nr:fibronectin type III domain-containing protein [Clostridiales bacterium]